MTIANRSSDKLFFLTVIRNNLLIYVEKIIKIISGVVIAAWMARYMGPSNFGKWSYALLIFSFFQSVVTLGIDSILVREIISRPNETHSLIANSIIGRLCLGFLSVGIVSIIAQFLSVTDKDYIGILFFMSLAYLFQPLDSIEGYFQASNKIKLITLSKITAYLISAGVKVYLIHIEAPLFLFAIANTIEILITNVIIYIMFVKLESDFLFKYDFSSFYSIISESKYYLASSLIIFLYMRVDQFLVLNFLGDQQLGIFMAATSLVSVFHLLPVIMSTSVMSYFSRTKDEDYNLYKRHIVFLFRFMMALSIAIIIFIYVFSDFIMFHIYGSYYEESQAILKILILSILPVFIGVIQSIHIILHKNNNMIFIRTLLGGILAVFLNVLFLKIWGLVGSACASVFTQYLIVFVAPYFFDNELSLMQYGFIN